MSRGTYIYSVIEIILNYAIEIYNWNQAGKNTIIELSDTPSWFHQILVYICS